MYYAELKDPEKGLNVINIHIFLNLTLDQYWNIGQTDINNNITQFNQTIDPSLPLAVYCHKQDYCKDFATDVNVPVYETTTVTTGTKNVLQCGNLVPAWQELRQTSYNQYK